MGLEDLEGCERFFSKSNALSRSTRYASIFHRRQSIATYVTYANLSTFLVNNYKQTVQILSTGDALHDSIDQLGVTDVSEFQSRIEEEMEYLKSLSKELEEDTDQMDYLKLLVTLSQKTVRVILFLSMNLSGEITIVPLLLTFLH
ncbi:hypothetical protein B0H13DRAFT_1872775 [Mycena leptocephala]|nr:hypothetical protein B0H13DRAFT_1872775 [Mycena leptocephala]